MDRKNTLSILLINSMKHYWKPKKPKQPKKPKKTMNLSFSIVIFFLEDVK